MDEWVKTSVQAVGFVGLLLPILKIVWDAFNSERAKNEIFKREADKRFDEYREAQERRFDAFMSASQERYNNLLQQYLADMGVFFQPQQARYKPPSRQVRTPEIDPVQYMKDQEQT